jgi:hypothetical protein
MKNKVDIGKLIEKKYKGNTLELSDILEQIDLVLQETVDYKYSSKIDTGDLGNLEEIDPGHARDISYRKHGPGRTGEIPDQLGYGDNVNVTPSVIPTTVAEAPEQGALSLARERTIKVPDLFSMITDPKKMSVGSPDRKLINNIMANIGLQQTTSWREKIQKLQNYVYTLLVPSEKEIDITQVISGLIFLNLFKKLAFFMEQPGKQFEYLFLPFLSPEAEVRGDESKEITDVVFDGNEYSLKFLQAREPTVRGSYDNLIRKIREKKYSMTLVARVMPAGIIEFAEFGITTYHDLIIKNYKIIGGQSETARVLWFESKGEDTTYPRFMCLLEPQISQLTGVESGAEKTKIKQLSYNVGGLSFPENQLANVKNILNSTQANINSKKPEDNKKAIETLSKTFEEFNKNSEEEKKNKENVLQFIQSIRDQLAAQSEKIKVAKGLQPAIQKEAKQEKQTGSGQFEIAIQGIWNTMVIQKLNLGNPDIYNKKLGFVAGEISNFYIDILDNLEQLNTNVTNYVATSSDTQRDTGSQTYANESIKNANEIAKSVNAIESKKK